MHRSFSWTRKVWFWICRSWFRRKPRALLSKHSKRVFCRRSRNPSQIPKCKKNFWETFRFPKTLSSRKLLEWIRTSWIHRKKRLPTISRLYPRPRTTSQNRSNKRPPTEAKTFYDGGRRCGNVRVATRTCRGSPTKGVIGALPYFTYFVLRKAISSPKIYRSPNKCAFFASTKISCLFVLKEVRLTLFTSRALRRFIIPQRLQRQNGPYLPSLRLIDSLQVHFRSGNSKEVWSLQTEIPAFVFASADLLHKGQRETSVDP